MTVRLFSALMAVACAAAVATALPVGEPSLTWTYDAPSRHRGVVRGTLHEASEGGWKACAPDVAQHSGYFTVAASTNKHYFYWSFGPRGGAAANERPVILWLTGGPGCSGTLALLKENGPCTVKSDGTLARNPYSWNEEATVVYVDQPAGVGFSYADQGGYDHNEAEVSQDLYFFLQALMQAHPVLRNSPLFIFGESYGGHYVPATAHRVWLGNQRKDGAPLRLTGLAIGNGLVAPAVQYKYNAELAYPYCQKVLGHPCVSYEAYQSMNHSIGTCVSFANRCDKGSGFACRIGQMFCNAEELNPYMRARLNPYDIRKKCINAGLCYDFSAVTTFMNRADVKAALGAPSSTKWQECNMMVNTQFSGDWMKRFDTMLPDLLHDNIRVLVYAGDMDFICNWLGNKAWALQMEWPQRAAFQHAVDVPLRRSGSTVAWARSVSGAATPILFTFLRVHGAGHMVPMDQPETALAAVRHFLHNTRFE